MAFDHNLTAFPLTGAHRFTDCVSCHANGYKGTSTVCVDCHMMDYTQSLNPDHKKSGCLPIVNNAIVLNRDGALQDLTNTINIIH